MKQRLEGAQTRIFVRLTIGAMREALKLVEKLFLESPLGKEFVPLLDQQASASLERIKKRFGKLDMLVVIRGDEQLPVCDPDESGFPPRLSRFLDSSFGCIVRRPSLSDLRSTRFLPPKRTALR